ncbi:hypothetical protein OO013_20040 [Mangrovivirga sp. M17]|uniref:Uncharacterized protein n=1 Tax=Mangrovivirga halotolerans TaxID=2993936 RepID=A0ABT3RWM8_9BACT|nr:hypothetical protein [Mangrovivirga halotolerans]MCX2746180.1 hypothetical protein [Mangrovivirga halotolerans]
MNFELADQLTELLKKKKLDKAIEIAESKLAKVPKTGFHQIIGKTLTHQTSELAEFISNFHTETTKILKKNQGLLKSIFNMNNNLTAEAYYCEMNGFTINCDLWFIDLFSYEKLGGEDWDWLADFYDSSSNSLTITGFEELQKVFEGVHENNKLEEPNINESYEICELLVILRLQELFNATYKTMDSDWSKIPMFVTAHDYDMIYRTN